MADKPTDEKLREQETVKPGDYACAWFKYYGDNGFETTIPHYGEFVGIEKAERP